MFERPTRGLLRSSLAGVMWLTACASAGPAGNPAPDAGPSEAKPVLESVNPGRPDDRAAQARREWLERQRALRRGTPPGTNAAPTDAPPAGVERGTPGKLLIFSSVTGHVPQGDPRKATAGTPEQRENERVEELERALEAEREREQQPEQAGADVAARPPAPPGVGDSVLVAPAAPELPDLDPSLLTSESTVVPAGSWDNAEDLAVVRKSLDRDGNGRPEEVRYYDVATNVLLRREEDRDLDGNTDTWSRYENAALVSRVLDTDTDGRPDEWETYASGRLTLREVDGDHDGKRDAVYRYRYDALVEVRRDTDGDGAIDHVEIFERRVRVRAIDDTNRDERMDTWTSYQVVAGQEVIVRIERDPKGIGRPTVFESYRAAPGAPVMVKLEQDLDGDGKIDQTRELDAGGATLPEQAAPL